MAVAAFAREVIMRLALRVDFGVEQHALIDQPLHAVARVAGDEFDGSLSHRPAPAIKVSSTCEAMLSVHRTPRRSRLGRKRWRPR